MAHIKESVEVERAVGAVYDQWLRFEESAMLRDLRQVHAVRGARLNWRAEVLTFSPVGDGTLVTRRLDYDAIGQGDGIRDALAVAARRLQEDLECFKSLVEGGRAEVECPGWTFGRGEPSHA